MSFLNFGPQVLYHTDIDGLNPVQQPLTQGGVQFNFSYETFDTNVDVAGNTAVNKYYVGVEANVVANYTNIQSMEELLQFFPDVSGNSVRIGIGCDAREDAISLLMRPFICGEVNTENENAFFFPVVLPIPDFNVTYSTSEQAIYTVRYDILPYDPADLDFSMFFIGQVGT